MVVFEKLYPIGFSVEQRVFEVYGVKFGGVPGLNPTVVIGSLFYTGDRKLVNACEGVIDREATIREIEFAKSVAEEYGLKLAIDLIGSSTKLFEKTLPLIADIANTPILIDSPSPKVRITGYKLAYEIGISDRCIANGLYTNSPKEEYEAIREYKIAASVVMGFDPSKASTTLTPSSRLELVTNKLIPKAKHYGIDRILLDAVVLDPSSISLCGITIKLFKDKLGLPSGAAPANALGQVSKKSFGVEDAIGIHSSSAVYLRLMGADFIFYGPLKRIKYIAPALSTIDSLLGYLLRLEGKRLDRQHPISKLLKRLHYVFTKTQLTLSGG